MKRIIQMLFLPICCIITSCHNEEVLQPAELITTQVDSSGDKEHNMVWKNRYYLLEFDSARARISNYSGIQGTGPAYIMFDSYFSDKYSTERFKLVTGVGQSMYGDSNHLYYNTAEVQQKIVWTENTLSNLYAYTYGTKMNQIYDPPLYSGKSVFPSGHYNNILQQWEYEVVELTVTSFSTYFQNGDRFADFNLTISGDSVQGNIMGKFRAQSNPL